MAVNYAARGVVELVMGGLTTLLAFVFLSCGPVPGFGWCGTPYELTLAAYFIGSIGGAIMAVGLWNFAIRRRLSTLNRAQLTSGMDLGGAVISFLGGVIMVLGFLFTTPCLGTLFSPNVSCGLHVQVALLAYLFGTMGAALLAGGVWKAKSGLKTGPAQTVH